MNHPPHRRLFYFCYSHDTPTGGQKHTYEHVDVLNANGFEAYAVHSKPNFRLTWFENATRTITVKEALAIRTDADIFVLPEDLGRETSSFPGLKVIFDKNAYYGFRAAQESKSDPVPISDSGIKAIIAVSEQNRQLLEYAYPHLRVCRVYCQIDPAIFRYRELSAKEKVVAWAPKVPNSVAAVCQVLQARAKAGVNPLGGFEWTCLSGMTQVELAEALQRSLVCIFLSVEEGLSRTPLEAMSCGCLVAGVDGGPMRECLPEEYRFRSADILGICKFVEEAAAAFPDKLEQYQPSVQRGLRGAGAFSRERQERSVITAWDQILSSL